MEKEYKWDEELYRKIENKVNENMPDFEGKDIFFITDKKYEYLLRKINEEYLTHVDGEYNGTKSELKKDKEFTSKALMKNIKNVTFYGDTIQEAIDDTSKVHGKVVIPGSDNKSNPNVYYTGALVLKSNVELHIEENVILKFVRNKSNEYYPLVYTIWEGIELMNFSHFIYSYEEENIAITGKGILDGNAD